MDNRLNSSVHINQELKYSIFTVDRPERKQNKMSVRSDEGASVVSEIQDPTAEAAANAKLYEPKKIRKIIRVLTVIAYVLSVSLAAIILSMYYLFLWDPKIPIAGKEGTSMALTDPEPQLNVSCFHLGNAFKTSVFPTLSLYLDLLHRLIRCVRKIAKSDY
jgi:hypothetical protein